MKFHVTAEDVATYLAVIHREALLLDNDEARELREWAARVVESVKWRPSVTPKLPARG